MLENRNHFGIIISYSYAHMSDRTIFCWCTFSYETCWNGRRHSIYIRFICICIYMRYIHDVNAFIYLSNVWWCCLVWSSRMKWTNTHTCTSTANWYCSLAVVPLLFFHIPYKSPENKKWEKWARERARENERRKKTNNPNNYPIWLHFISLWFGNWLSFSSINKHNLYWSKLLA